MRDRFRVRVERSDNFNKYTLLDYGGRPMAKVDSQTWGVFQPTTEQVIASFRLLVPGAAEFQVDVDVEEL
jgi:hypothetical protein